MFIFQITPDCSPAPVIPDAVVNFSNVIMEMKNDPRLKRDPSKMEEIEQNLVIVRRLIKGGCDVNRAGDDGLPVLQIAAQCPDVRLLRVLLRAGANANMRNDRASAKGRSPLTKAVDVNNKAAVKLLLQYGADVNIRCRLGSQTPTTRFRTQTLLTRCLETNHIDIAILLVKAGSDVSYQDRVFIDRQLSSILNMESHDDGWETEEEEEIIGHSSVKQETNVTIENPTHALTLSKCHATRDPAVAGLLQLRDLVNKPLTLKGLCRKYVRQNMCIATPSQVKFLSVPRIIKEYVLCRDL